jgi:hypothetical protein
MRFTTLSWILLTSAGCGWAAADGSWNDPVPEPTPEISAAVAGEVLTPDGDRSVSEAAVELLNEAGARVGTGVTDPFGVWAFDGVPAGRYTVLAAIGHFQSAADFDVEAAEVVVPALRLSNTLPIVLDVRDEAGRAFDPVGARLEALGLVSVRTGPESGAVAASSFGQPQGLFEYGLVLLGGDLDWTLVAADVPAMDGLEDFVRAGGGLVVSGSAWPVLAALVPGVIEVVEGDVAAFGYTEAYADPTLVKQLQWQGVGVPIREGMRLVEGIADHAHLALAGDVVTLSGDVVTSALAVEIELGEGTVLFLSFAAPEPRADEWWQGDPATYRLPDGSWDGRGAALDRLLLRL